jgi:hypothetical protein
MNDEKEKVLKNNDECRMMNDEKKVFQLKVFLPSSLFTHHS